jgi:hypothetical protein
MEEHRDGLIVVCVLSVIALVGPLIGLPPALLRPGEGWASRWWNPTLVLLASVGAHAVPTALRPVEQLSSCLWLALAIWSRHRPQRLLKLASLRRPWLARTLLVLPSALGVLLAFTVLQCGYHFSAPRTWEARLLCAATPPGSSIDRFSTLTWVLGLSTVSWAENEVETIDTWLFMHYGCKVTFDDEGNVVTAGMWSVS